MKYIVHATFFINALLYKYKGLCFIDSPEIDYLKNVQQTSL